MFKTVNQDNATLEVTIAGARSRATSNQDIATLIFRNYDADTNNSYRLATISARDAYGTADSNGFGALIFSTNPTGTTSNTIRDQMIITHTGYVGINTLNPQTHLEVNGSVKIASNLSAPAITSLQNSYMALSNYTYQLPQSSSNGQIDPYSSNTASYSSNTSTYSSNTATYSSNTATYSSNTAFYSSNTASYSSNTASYSSNTATYSSNTATYSSNAIKPIPPPITQVQDITNTDFIKVYSWINSSNSLMLPPSSLYVNSYLVENSNAELTSSNFKYTLRLYNSTANAYLGQVTLSNNTPIISAIPITTSNINPLTLSIIELHAKKETTVGNYIRINGLSLNY